ncbi:MAG: carbon-nitrogen hydrolase family protein [Alphaproteobacteria bacterium]|nr:carbon-nitrogen hydrolase family protein [Alphaproteobacteria bacterium]
MIAAAIQMTSGDDMAANIAALEPLLAAAVAQGATFVATPENTFYMRREGTAAMTDMPMAEHEGVRYAMAAARQHRIWLLIGSVRAKEAGMDKPFNRSILISPAGDIAATYDKIHLFDVTLANGDSYRESSQAMAGTQAVLAEVEAMGLGMSICYDLRFPTLYRTLALRGAQVLAVPSAFTRPTGAAHWHTLLKARAIENACYVVAPAQCGTHPGGRETYGHSLIIDPWGEVLAEAVEEVPQVIVATLDPARVAQVRAQIPVLAHHRPLD